MKIIDCINVIADKPFLTSFHTEKELSEEEVSKIQSYSQEIYGSGIKIEEFQYAFVEALKLLLHIDFEPYHNITIPKIGDNTYDIHIRQQYLD